MLLLLVLVLLVVLLVVLLLSLLLLLALIVLLLLVLCAGVGALGASSAFAELVMALTWSLQVVGSILLDLLRVVECVDCCAYAKCLFFCFC